MKKPIFTLLLLLNSLLIFGQDEIPEFGKIDKADLQLKKCTFDKDASAYKLLSLGDVDYEMGNGNFNIVNDHRVRIKILNEEGLKKANVAIQFYSKSGYKAIKDISGITYNLDDNGNIVTTPLSKDSIRPKKISNKLAEISFTMPDVKVGSVIEYEFSYIEKSIANIDDWYFQDDIPTQFSMYRVTVPFMFKFETTAYAYQDIERENLVLNQNATYRRDHLAYASSQKSYILRNVPALKKEPYMSGVKDYLQRITFRLSQIEYGNGEKEDVKSDWPQVTKDLLADPDFGLQLKKKLSHTKKLDELLTNVSDKFEKMNIIYSYILKNIKWNGDESVYTSKGVSAAWYKKSGNTAELNFALILLLRDAGLEAYPLLASSNENGEVNTQYPLLRQFNMTLACVVIDGKKYILNAADKYNLSALVPSEVLDNNGFIVDTQSGGWIQLSSDKGIFQNSVVISARVTADSLTGNAVIRSSGYAKVSELNRIKGEQDTLENFYAQSYDGMHISNVQFTNTDMDTASLQQEFDFSMPVISRDGNKTFSLNLFQGLDKNPFIDEARKTDVDYNYKQSYTIAGKIEIPDNYQFIKLPQDARLMMPDSGIIAGRFLKTAKNSLEFHITIDINNTLYKAGDYTVLKDFYSRLYTALNEQIAIRRKK